MTTSIRIALGALGANKPRTALTMLGITIGVAAVIALMSVGRGAEAHVNEQIRNLGTNLVFVRPGSTNDRGVRTGAGKAPTLTLDDAQAVADISGVLAVAPEVQTGAHVVADGQNWTTRILGVTETYAPVRNLAMGEGDWVSDEQVNARATVAVLGDSVAKQLFPDGDVVGRRIRITVLGGTGVTFNVIGVAAPKGASDFGSPDDEVYMPITALMTRLFAQRSTHGAFSVTTLSVQVTDDGVVDRAVADIGSVLRARHKVSQDDFTVQSQRDFETAATRVSGTFTLLLGAIAAISLFVGGIGVMNIMLVSVTERTGEIGIRRAVGALRRDILMQFLVESVFVSVLGGLVGIGLGSGLAASIGRIAVATGSAPSSTLETRVGLDSVVLAFAVSATVGVLFGLLPAARAARLNPIDALRYE